MALAVAVTALCLVALASTPFLGHTTEGRIVRVTDGDTVTMLDSDDRQHKVRLDGIDAREIGQPFGRASKRHLADLLAGRKSWPNAAR